MSRTPKTAAGSVGTNARALLIAQLGRYAIQFGGTAVLSRLLSPADFGIYAVVSAIMVIATAMGDLGLSIAAIRVPTLSRSQWTGLFWVNTGLGLLLTLATIAAAPGIAQLLGDPELTKFVIAISPCFLLNGISVQYRVELNRNGQFGALGVVETVAPTLAALGAVGLAIWRPSPWPLIAQPVLAAFLLAVAAIAAVRRSPGLPRRRAGIRALVLTGGALAISTMVEAVANNSGAIALGRAVTSAEVGSFAQALNIAWIAHLALGVSLTRAVIPALSGLSERPDFARALGGARAGYLYSTALVTALVGGLAAPVVLVLLGRQWVELTPQVLQILALGVVLQAPSFILYWGLVAEGKTGIQLRLDWPIRLATVVGVFAVASLGPLAVAAVYTVGAALRSVVYLALVPPLLDFSRRRFAWQTVPSLVVLGVIFGGALAITGLFPELAWWLQATAGLAWAALVAVGGRLVSGRVRADENYAINMVLEMTGLRARFR